MLNNIYIDQRRIVELGLDLDLIDLAILNVIEYAILSNSTIKQVVDGTSYTMIKYKFVQSQLPLLKMSRTTIFRRIKKLRDCGLLEAYENNQTESVALFKLGAVWERLKSDTPVPKSGHPSPKNETPPVPKSGHPSPKNETPPVPKSGLYNNIIDNNITNKNIINNEKQNNLELFNLFWASYPNKNGKIKAQETFLKLSYTNACLCIEKAKEYAKFKEFDAYVHCHATTFINQKRYLNEYTRTESRNSFEQYRENRAKFINDYKE